MCLAVHHSGCFWFVLVCGNCGRFFLKDLLIGTYVPRTALACVGFHVCSRRRAKRMIHRVGYRKPRSDHWRKGCSPPHSACTGVNPVTFEHYLKTQAIPNKGTVSAGVRTGKIESKTTRLGFLTLSLYSCVIVSLENSGTAAQRAR